MMSTYGARRRISSWSFWAMQPSTPMTLLGMLLLVPAQSAELAVDLVLGVLADAAGVEEDHVGVVGFVRSTRSPAGAGCRRRARCRARSSGSRRFRCRVFWSCLSQFSAFGSALIPAIETMIKAAQACPVAAVGGEAGNRFFLRFKGEILPGCQTAFTTWLFSSSSMLHVE